MVIDQIRDGAPPVFDTDAAEDDRLVDSVAEDIVVVLRRGVIDLRRNAAR